MLKMNEYAVEISNYIYNKLKNYTRTFILNKSDKFYHCSMLFYFNNILRKK